MRQTTLRLSLAVLVPIWVAVAGAECAGAVAADQAAAPDTTAGLINSVASLITAIVWPALVALLLITHREEVRGLLRRIQRIKYPGGEIGLKEEIAEELRNTEVQAGQKKTRGVTEEELARSRTVQTLTGPADLPAIRAQMLALATEYTQIRGSMMPGNERTRRMEVVVSKMRTLGAAAYPLRREFAGSSQAGERLAALAILQVLPDPEMIDWVAERISARERPFVQYHALLAFLFAVRSATPETIDKLRTVYRQAVAELEAAHPDTDLRQLLASIGRELGEA